MSVDVQQHTQYEMASDISKLPMTIGSIYKIHSDTHVLFTDGPKLVARGFALAQAYDFLGITSVPKKVDSRGSQSL